MHMCLDAEIGGLKQYNIYINNLTSNIIPRKTRSGVIIPQ